MRLEGLGKWKEFSGLIKTRTRDCSAWSVAPQPSTLSRSPSEAIVLILLKSLVLVLSAMVAILRTVSKTA
jgi:hypothetical protein